jgi:hypothetical protein
MTNEQMQSTMQFILDQQAQFVADMQQVKEHIHTLTDALLSLARITEENAKQTDQRFRETDAKIARVAEHLDGFIAFVEKYIHSRDGGMA